MGKKKTAAIIIAILVSITVITTIVLIPHQYTFQGQGSGIGVEQGYAMYVIMPRNKLHVELTCSGCIVEIKNSTYTPVNVYEAYGAGSYEEIIPVGFVLIATIVVNVTYLGDYSYTITISAYPDLI
ncbi:MAG: hypothetical protein ACTSSI_13695 [Candidatus Helarchaeota archaeon]